jgi:hypothetical protein
MYTYYNELRARPAGSYELADLCFSYTKKLRELDDDLRTQVSSWMYALIYQHRLVTDKKNDKYPYQPIITDNNANSDNPDNSSQLLTYNITKLPKVLQSVLACFMMDCLNSL